MNKLCFLGKKNEKGMALLTVVLLSSLIVGLVLVALTNSKIGSILTKSHLKDKMTLSCAEGAMQTATRLLREDAIDPASVIPGITFDQVTDGRDPELFDLVEELAVSDILSNDDPTINPDMIINDPATPGCITAVDIDLLKIVKKTSEGPPEEALGQILYHGSGVVGPGSCSSAGLYYSVAAVTTGPNGYVSTVRGITVKCINSA